MSVQYWYEIAFKIFKLTVNKILGYHYDFWKLLSIQLIITMNKLILVIANRLGKFTSTLLLTSIQLLILIQIENYQRVVTCNFFFI